MNVEFDAHSQEALTLEVDKLRESHTIPHDDVEYFDARYWPSPDVLHFIPKHECIVVSKQG
jgi:hypothetical protein